MVRGIAACLDLDWHQTLDALAEIDEYAHPTINLDKVFRKLLIKNDFKYHQPITKNGRLLTGAEFCAYIRDMYPEGSVFLVHIGKRHVAAIKRLKGSYKIYDTWDSTKTEINWFYVKYPESTPSKLAISVPREPIQTKSVIATSKK